MHCQVCEVHPNTKAELPGFLMVCFSWLVLWIIKSWAQAWPKGKTWDKQKFIIVISNSQFYLFPMPFTPSSAPDAQESQSPNLFTPNLLLNWVWSKWRFLPRISRIYWLVLVHLHTTACVCLSQWNLRA